MNPPTVQINTRYTRSIHIQRDQEQVETIAAYLPTSRSIQTLQRIADTFSAHDTPRSWALIGPYGSGKSAFALFLSALMSPPDSPLQQQAHRQLIGAHHRPLSEAFARQIGGSKGALRIHLNGSPDSLASRLYTRLHQVSHDYGLYHGPLQSLLEGYQPHQSPLPDLIALLAQMQQQWAEAGGSGVLLVIDELGQFLQYQAHHTQNSEIHLLQLLAEQAYTAHAAPLWVVVSLHQAFEHYSQGVGQRLRDEWRKVQGRYESIAYLEPAEQVLQVIAQAFESPANSAVTAQATAFATELAESLPYRLTVEAAAELFRRCYPLHPVTLLILPLLCQKVAQNERTLFTYLGSHEPHGLQQQLIPLAAGEWVGPWTLYDYFITHQPSVMADPSTRHRWAEVETALDRLGHGEASPLQQLLKTVGLLNLIQIQGGFKANRPLLQTLFKPADLEWNLTQLEQYSLVRYHRFSGEYRVWQGSDFDLSRALKQQLHPNEPLPLATLLNTHRPLEPIVARRLSIETGTLRYYQPFFIDAESLQQLQQPRQGGVPHLWFYLPQPGGDPIPIATLPIPAHDGFVQCHRALVEPLHEAVLEWQALLRVAQAEPILHQDPVALKEYQSELSQREQSVQRLLQQLLHQPQEHQWWYQHQLQTITSRRQLQQKLSDWLAACYPDAPIMKNELINRDNPSSSANTGRKKLLHAMLTQSRERWLGIDRYPPEKSIYMALLQKSELHRMINHQRLFARPTETNDPFQFIPWWDAVTAYLDRHDGSAVPLVDLYAELKKPPFGIKEGVLPVLITAYLLAQPREVALYQEGNLCDQLTLAQLEMLCRRPNYFSLERFNLGGLRGDLFQRYLGSIVGTLKEEATLLDIVKPLASFTAQLPDYTRQTRHLSPTTQAVREALLLAQSPGKLLFEALPAACGSPSLHLASSDAAATERFIQRLIEALRELKSAYPQLLMEWQQQLAALLLPDLDTTALSVAELRHALTQRYQRLEPLTPDKRGLGAFIHRLCQSQPEEERWRESTATLLSRVPPAKWSDSQRLEAEVALKQMAQRLLDLAQLALAIGTEPTESEVVLLKWIDPQRGDRSRVVRFTPQRQSVVVQKEAELEQLLTGVDEETRLAVIARLLHRLEEPKSER